LVQLAFMCLTLCKKKGKKENWISIVIAQEISKNALAMHLLFACLKNTPTTY
jgi:hypothetical protein